MFAVLLLLAVVPSVFAAQIGVESLPVHESVIPGEQAAFDIRITNNQDSEDVFRMSSNDLYWDLLSDPLYDYFSGVEIRAGDSKTVRLLLNTLEDLEYGQYRVDVAVKSQKGKNSATVPVYITVRPEKPLIREYLAAVTRIVEIPPVIHPGQNITVKVNLINRNPKNLPELKVLLSSNLINREVVTSLEPLQSKVLEEKFVLDARTPPQGDVLTVQLIADGNVLEPVITERFEIGSFGEIEIQSADVDKQFLRTVEKRVYANTGNVRGDKIVELESSGLKKLFTSTEPDSFTITKDGKKYVAWQLSLGPQESIAVTRTVSYRIILFIALLSAGAAAAYYLFRSPVVAVKKANVVNLKGGGISELKIIVHLRNRSPHTYERITVTDRTPTIADVTVDHGLGTVKPSSVYNDGRRTIVKWEIKTLEKGEELMLSYNMNTRLVILGTVKLAPVSVRFFSARGAKLVTRSRAVEVSA